jgi:hypothetical protein
MRLSREPSGVLGSEIRVSGLGKFAGSHSSRSKRFKLARLLFRSARTGSTRQVCRSLAFHIARKWPPALPLAGEARWLGKKCDRKCPPAAAAVAFMPGASQRSWASARAADARPRQARQAAPGIPSGRARRPRGHTPKGREAVASRVVLLPASVVLPKLALASKRVVVVGGGGGWGGGWSGPQTGDPRLPGRQPEPAFALGLFAKQTPLGKRQPRDCKIGGGPLSFLLW